jgi:hypothetical protein
VASYGGLGREPNQARIMDGLQRLRAQLDAELPPKSLETSMLLATWNIREFDSPAYGDRIADAFYYIAEIVSRFDLIAVQEVRRNIAALNRLMSHLGGHWKYLVTDTTEGDAGNDERLAFVYDSRKLRFGGLAGELVLPPVKSTTDGKTETRPATQIARTPYTAGFSAGWTRFQLATVHVLYGDDAPDDPARVEEINQIASFLAARAEEADRWSDNLVLLGDFNIYDTVGKAMDALTSNGWLVPKSLQNIPGTNVPQDKHYDQIAVRPKKHWFEPTALAGVIDYYNSVFRDDDRDLFAPDMGDAYNVTSEGKPRTDSGKAQYFHTYWRTFQMSDHLPMWMELRIDYSQEYLQGLRSEPPPTEPHT